MIALILLIKVVYFSYRSFIFNFFIFYRLEMESEEEKWEKLDAEFDHFVVDMKPFVLKLPHRSGKIVFEN